MKVVFLHGAPAAGKLTIREALLRSVPGRLFDNHAAIDVVRTVFDFGAPGFWELVQTVRAAVLNEAAERSVPLVVMTFVYVGPGDLPVFQEFESIVQRHEGQMLPVFLRCSTEEILRRVCNADRVEGGKMSSKQGAREFLAGHKVAPVPRPNCLVLDSEFRSAEATAHEIIRHFNICQFPRP